MTKAMHLRTLGTGYLARDVFLMGMKPVEKEWALSFLLFHSHDLTSKIWVSLRLYETCKTSERQVFLGVDEFLNFGSTSIESFEKIDS